MGKDELEIIAAFEEMLERATPARGGFRIEGTLTHEDWKKHTTRIARVRARREAEQVSTDEASREGLRGLAEKEAS